MTQCELDQLPQVIEMYPGHPLPARAEPSRNPQPEGGDHAGERASAGSQDDADAELRDANSERRGLIDRPLQFDADLRQKALAWRGPFVEDLVAPRAIEPDRGGADQYARRRGQLFEFRYQTARAIRPACKDALLRLGGPTLSYRFTRQVDHCAARRNSLRLPQLDRPHIMAGSSQAAGEGTTDESACSSQCDDHRRSLPLNDI